MNRGLAVFAVIVAAMVAFTAVTVASSNVTSETVYLGTDSFGSGDSDTERVMAEFHLPDGTACTFTATLEWDVVGAIEQNVITARSGFTSALPDGYHFSSYRLSVEGDGMLLMTSDPNTSQYRTSNMGGGYLEVINASSLVEDRYEAVWALPEGVGLGDWSPYIFGAEQVFVTENSTGTLTFHISLSFDRQGLLGIERVVYEKDVTVSVSQPETS